MVFVTGISPSVKRALGPSHTHDIDRPTDRPSVRESIRSTLIHSQLDLRPACLACVLFRSPLLPALPHTLRDRDQGVKVRDPGNLKHLIQENSASSISFGFEAPELNDPCWQFGLRGPPTSSDIHTLHRRCRIWRTAR